MKYTVPRSDLRLDTFRSGGNGGQNTNKRDTGVRITHTPSGAVGESREERSQLQNRKTALQRLADHPIFRAWICMHLTALEQGHKSVEDKVDRLMADHNLKVETGPEAAACKQGEKACDVR